MLAGCLWWDQTCSEDVHLLGMLVLRRPLQGLYLMITAVGPVYVFTSSVVDTRGHNIFKVTAVKVATRLHLVQNECILSLQVKGMKLAHHESETLSCYCAFAEG